MIEDFMILANTTVASHMAYLGLPLIYRNHDYPKQEKIDSFINTMEKFGVTFKGNPYKIESKVLNKCLEKFEDSDDYYLVSEMLLRCMAKALYSHNCNGHYGLGLEHYCHFTSPIRRYPDLIVHRMLKKYVLVIVKILMKIISRMRILPRKLMKEKRRLLQLRELLWI